MLLFFLLFVFGVCFFFVIPYQKLIRLYVSPLKVFVTGISISRRINSCTHDEPEDHWSCIAHLSAEEMLGNT